MPRNITDSTNGPGHGQRFVSFNIGAESDTAPRCDHIEMSPLLSNENLDDTCCMDVRPKNDENKELLVELFDLRREEIAHGRWVESCRWIKYEEDVEGLDHHWGLPHVPCLFFETITALKVALRKAHMVMDIEVTTHDELMDQVYQSLSEEPIVAEEVKRLMMLSKVHFNSCRKVKQSVTSPRMQRINTQPNLGNERNTRSLSTIHGHRAVDRSVSTPLRTQTSVSSSRLAIRAKSTTDLYDLPDSAQVFVGDCPDFVKTRLIFVRLAEPADFPEVYCENVKEAGINPVKFVIFILGPPCDVMFHEMGRSLCTMLANPSFKTLALKAQTGDQLVEGLDKFLSESVVLGPGQINNTQLIQGDGIKRHMNMREELKKSRAEARASVQIEAIEPVEELIEERNLGYFEILKNDVRNRLPYYKSDFLDAMNRKCFTALIFMFLSCIAPTITFGGLMAQYTGETMGLMETVFAQALCCTLWSLLAAQPLIIVSPTGPVLIFEGALFMLSQMLDLDFLSVRLLCGIWIFSFSLIVSAFNGTKYLKLVTPFVEDIFAVIISIIFMSASKDFLVKTFLDNPAVGYEDYEKVHLDCLNRTLHLNHSDPDVHVTCPNMPEPNTALLTLLVLFGTAMLSFFMRVIRQSVWFGRRFRSFVGDFGVFFALCIVYGLVQLFGSHVHLELLDMPDRPSFTNSGARGHGLIVIPNMSAPLQMLALSFVAGFFQFILLFTETGITGCLLSRKDRMLVKGTGMSWDLVLSGVLTLLCSVLGLPWMCAGAVQSVAHVTALSEMKQKAPGERDAPAYVHEQRATTLGLAFMFAAFAFCGPMTRLPMACLFGVFLYLGFMNLNGVKFIERLNLFITSAKHYPASHYVQRVSKAKIFVYTGIQIALIVLVLVVKSITVTAPLFPFLLAMITLFRYKVLPKYYTTDELAELDPEEDAHVTKEEEDVGINDFYGQVPIPV